MKFDYRPIADEVIELIYEFGTEMTMHIPGTEGTWDPVTEETTGGNPPTQRKFQGVKIAPTTDYAQSVGTGMIEARDMLIYMEPAFEPKMDYSVETDGERWNIINIITEKPADVPILYILQVRP